MRLKTILFAILLVLAIQVRTYNHDEAHIRAFDPYYMVRVARVEVENGFFPNIDPLRYYPLEWKSIDLNPVTTRSISSLCIGENCNIKFAGKWQPVIYGVLSVIVLGAIGLKFYNAPLLPAVFLALMPGFLYRTSTGFAEKDPITIFLMLISMYFFFNSQSKKELKSNLIYGSLSGIALGIAALAGGIFALIFLPMALYVILRIVLMKKFDQKNLAIIPLSLFAFLIAVTIPKNPVMYMLKTYFGIGSAVSSLLVIVSSVLNKKLKISKEEKLYASIFATSILGLLFFFVFGGSNIFTVISGIFTNILSPIRGAGTINHASSVGEQQAPINTFPTSGMWNSIKGQDNYWFIRLAFPLLLLYITVKVFSKFYKENLKGKSAEIPVLSVLLIFTLLFIDKIFSPWMTVQNDYFRNFHFAVIILVIYSYFKLFELIYNKFSSYFKENKLSFEMSDITLLTFSWVLFSIYASTTAVRLFFTSAPAIAFAAGVISKKALSSTSKYLKMFVAIVLIFLTVFPSSVLGFKLNSMYAESKIIGQSMSSSMTRGWYENLKWMKHNTGEEQPIVTWWDYGYWIQTVADRKTLGDGSNSQPYDVNTETGSFFANSTIETSVGWMNEKDMKWVTTDNTMIGKFYWISRLGGKGTQYQIFPYQKSTQIQFNGELLDANVYAATQEQMILSFNVNGTTFPIITNSDASAQMFIEFVISPIGTYNVSRVLPPEVPVIPGGVLFGGDAAVFAEPAARDSMFTKLYFENGLMVPFEITFDNAETKTFRLTP